MITANLNQTINKINYTPNALYIEAKFNNSNIPITIDTGANISCIRQQILPPNYILTPNKIQLSGPDNKPLCVSGISKIKITINEKEFNVHTYVVKDLSSAILLGNDFLIEHNALIDFKDNIIILDGNTNIKLLINYSNALYHINKTRNVLEIKDSIFNSPPDFAIAHCISADLKMSAGITKLLCQTYGNTTPELSAQKLKIGDTIPINMDQRTIFHLITKQLYYHKPKYEDLKSSIHNLKIKAQQLNILKIAMPTIASGLDKLNWSIVKQLIYSEFQDTNIELHIYHSDLNDTTHDSNSIERNDIINNTHTFSENESKNKVKSNNTETINKNHAHNIFYMYKPGENVPSDGNCGLYAVCNALNDHKINKITSIHELLELLGLNNLPDYWWSDEELASIANYYGHDTYVYNNDNNTGLTYGDGKRPPIVLYNCNKNTHWVPGTLTNKKSNKIPNTIMHIIEFPTIDTLRTSVKIRRLKDGVKNTNDNVNRTEESEAHNHKIINEKQTDLFKTQIHTQKAPHMENNHNITKCTTQSNTTQSISLINLNTKQSLTDLEGTPFIISPKLNTSQHNQVVELLNEYIHIFTTDTSNIKAANVTPCEIKMKPNYKEPKFNAPHRVSPQQRIELQNQIIKLSEAGIVKPITSKFAAPAFLVKKKDVGSYRLVVSYKELNDRVESDQYPIPRTTDLLRALEGSNYFTSLDLNSGFFQIPVREKDQYKLAFTSVMGLLTFSRLPQGYKNSSAIFQRELNRAFSPLLYKSLVIYIDDLASYGKTFDESLHNLRLAFKILDKMNFSLKTKKCNFFCDKIEILGHEISTVGIRPLDRNTKAITEFKLPKTIKDVRSFIGMCSYYRKHVKDFAKIAHPLSELIKKGVNKIEWLDEHDISFNKLKKCLTTEPLLRHFNDDKHTFLTVDASIMGLGACLEQANENNTLHPVGFASRKLLDSEKTYSSTTLELLGLCFGITYFREYLWGRKFTVFCDNISMQYYNNLKIPSARIARLTLKLLDFDFDIIYKKGKENVVADALSRNAINNIKIINRNENDNNQPHVNLHDIKTQQIDDEFCSKIIKALTNKEVPISTKRKSRQFTIINDTLYYKKYAPPKGQNPILVIPKTLTYEILKSYHDSPTGGHTGISRTIHKIQNKYYWPTLNKDTTDFIKSCEECQSNKKMSGRPAGLLQPIPIITGKPLERVTFDYLGPLPSSNKKRYILVAACNTTKYIFTKAVESATAETTVKFLIEIITQWGCFRNFSSDRGTHFRNKLVNDICTNLGIKQTLSTSYSPQTQGLVEKINGIITGSLKNYLEDNNQTKWSYYLPYITLAYNSTPQTTTKYSPFYLMHGFEPQFPIDNKIIPEDIPYQLKESLIELNKIRNKIPQRIHEAQIIQKKYHDKTHKAINYNTDDLVMVEFPFSDTGKSPKLGPRYRGPFKIIKKTNDLNYKVRLILNNKEIEDTIHVRRLKPFYSRLDENVTYNNKTA